MPYKDSQASRKILGVSSCCSEGKQNQRVWFQETRSVIQLHQMYGNLILFCFFLVIFLSQKLIKEMQLMSSNYQSLPQDFELMVPSLMDAISSAMGSKMTHRLFEQWKSFWKYVVTQIAEVSRQTQNKNSSFDQFLR